MTEKSTVDFGALVQKLRLEKGLSLDEFALKLDHNQGQITAETVVSWENNTKPLSTAKIGRICDSFDLDEFAFYKGKLVPVIRLTPEEMLEKIEPGGQGSIFQRVARLRIHDQIRSGTVQDISGFHLNDADFPVLETTGCTCPGCREFVAYQKSKG